MLSAAFVLSIEWLLDRPPVKAKGMNKHNLNYNEGDAAA